MALALVARLIDPATADLIAHVIEYTRHADERRPFV
jgi:hypothetical protein